MRLQRERSLARRRPNKWLTEPVDPPDREVLEFAEYRMSVVDSMPPRWRALVHRFGFEAVAALYGNGGGDPMVAWGQLEAIATRANRGKS